MNTTQSPAPPELRDHPVLVLYNLPRTDPRFREADEGIFEEVHAVTDALRTLGLDHRAVGIRRLADLRAVFDEAPEPLVINLTEALDGDPFDFTLVPAACRAAGRSPTGGDTPCLTVALDKWQTKAALAAAGVPAPPAAVVPPGAPPPADLPAGPLLVKPLRADASEGIEDASILPGPGPGLDTLVAAVHQRFGQPALIESFVDGREINVSILQRGDDLHVLPLAEIDFAAYPPGKPRIVGYTAKWHPGSFEFDNTPRRIPAPLETETAERIRKLALRAWHAVGCLDYARVDFRLPPAGDPLVLEINPNPDVAPDAGFAAALEAAGIPWPDFVRAILENAIRRLMSPAAEESAEVLRDAPPPLIRRTTRADRAPILDLLACTGFFPPPEIEIAREVLDSALAHGPDGHYQTLTACLSGRPAGWLCFGPTPCTRGTFDIYWVAVAPEAQRRGVGRALMAQAERMIAASGGCLAVIETAGRPQYEPTRKFYRRCGYTLAARVPDFYAPGDDKLVFTRTLP
jgi:D-alanine-D-alanine ligase-like ATP-grasp enzyme/ribosomal protein S18 acetylase RimI-like enzyme